MKIMLRDMPGACAFIHKVAEAASTLAIVMVDRPDDEVRAQLDITRANLERDLAPEMGAKGATEFADIFCRAVMGEKHEREALAAMRLL
jgi:hypothetical protein